MQKRKKVSRIVSIISPIIAFAAIICVWAIAAAIIDSSFVLPTVSETITALSRLLTKSFFWRALAFTLLRALYGYVIAFVLAVALAIAALSSKTFAAILSPIVSVMRSLPTMAAALLLSVWTGTQFAPVCLSVIVIMPIIYSALISAKEAISPSLNALADLDGLTKLSRVKNVYLPTAAPIMAETLATAASFNIKLIIAAEIMSQTAESLGTLMRNNQMYLDIAALIALTVAAVIISVAVEALLKLCLKRLCKSFNYD